jgi:hypothetical protein
VSDHNQINEKWTSVVRNNSKRKMMCDTNAVNVQQNFVTTNRYAPLSSLPENHNNCEVVLKHGNEDECEALKNMKTAMVTSLQHKTCRKIPTIVNGQVLNNDNDEVEWASWLTNIQIRTHCQRPTKFTHKVEVLGDSHLIGSAAVINQNLDEKYRVCSLTQPGACTKQTVDSQEEILKSLGKNDVIVINGGSNDIGSSTVVVATMFYSAACGATVLQLATMLLYWSECNDVLLCRVWRYCIGANTMLACRLSVPLHYNCYTAFSLSLSLFYNDYSAACGAISLHLSILNVTNVRV